MDEFIYANENEIFSGLMDEFIRGYGEELLLRSRQLKADDAGHISALSYVRCRELIRKEFAAVRRRGVLKAVRISSAAACALVILAVGTVMLVPSLHDSLFGRSEEVQSVTVPGSDMQAPAFRRNLPSIMIPEPEDTDDPSVGTEQTVSRDHVAATNAYIEDQLRLRLEEINEREQEEWLNSGPPRKVVLPGVGSPADVLS